MVTIWRSLWDSALHLNLGCWIPNWKSLKFFVIASLVVSPKCNNAKNTMNVSSWSKHGCSPCRPRLPHLSKPIFSPSADRGARREAEDDRDGAAQHGTDWRLDGSQAHLDQKVEKESQRADRYLNPRHRPSTGKFWKCCAHLFGATRKVVMRKVLKVLDIKTRYKIWSWHHAADVGYR